jgi:pyruvate formate lyase activating enzyme
VRYNEGGELRVPWGYVAGLQADPVEKKPFFHLLPGSDALTFGMLGCNFHCGYCQNWITSQTLRDPEADASLSPTNIHRVTPADMVAYGQRAGARLVVSSYNEPTITSEWAVEIFKAAKAAGFTCAYVSNGYATLQVFEYLKPYLTGYKVDLKSMRDAHYRSLGGVLQNVLDSIRLAHDLGFWVEIVTLVIPGFNDSDEELRDAAQFLASVSPDIPWHLTAFHPDYKQDNTPYTPARTLRRAAEIGREAGLHFVYAGNLPGQVGSLENTHCPTCSALLVERHGLTVMDYKINADGKCPQCAASVPGRWTDRPETVNVGGWAYPRRVV